VIGSALLLVGLFLPFVGVAFVGDVNYFQSGVFGIAEGVIVLLLAVTSALLVLTPWRRGLWVTGICALVLVIFRIVLFQVRKSQLRASLEQGSGEDSFRGLESLLVEGMQLRWGSMVMLIGAALVITSALMAELRRRQREPNARGLKVELVCIPLAVVIAGGAAWAFALIRPVQESSSERAGATRAKPAAVGDSRREDGPSIGTHPTERAPAPGRAASELTPPSPQEAAWADASKDAVQQGDVRVRVTGVRIGIVPLGAPTSQGQSTDPFLQISLTVEDLSKTKIVHYDGWGSAQYSGLPSLKDNFDNSYRRVRFGFFDHPTGQVVGTADIYPGKSVFDVLVFALPVEGVQYLRLTLPAKNVDGSGELRLQIPAGMIRR
jgi:hypothetical protein